MELYVMTLFKIMKLDLREDVIQVNSFSPEISLRPEEGNRIFVTINPGFTSSSSPLLAGPYPLKKKITGGGWEEFSQVREEE